jgi:uncharacterized damage-inducible protein DinB
MNKALAEMFRYNAWANRELFGACRSLTEGQLDMRIQGISGSVRELLMHIAGGQQTFVLRTKGRQLVPSLERQPRSSERERLRQRSQSIHQIPGQSYLKGLDT